MLAPLSQRKESQVTVIPNSGIQFLDLGVNLEPYRRYSRSFWEHPKDDGSGNNVLRALVDGDSGDLVDAETRAAPEKHRGYAAEAVYDRIAARDAIEVYLGKWIPVPFMRVTHLGVHGPEGFAKGPSNWARLRIVELAEPDLDGHTHRVTLAFETELLPAPDESRPYLGPSPQDVDSRQVFACASHERDCGWWLKEGWVDGWLAELWTECRNAKRRGAPLDPEEARYRTFEHWARYLVLLGLFREMDLFPTVRVVEPNANPIDVDLVLDVGNSRTCGILIEASAEEGPALSNSYELELRDLTRPERVYREPFETRLEFALASFGKELWSRRGGRSRAFSWVTVARIGPEASYLAHASRGTEGNTGMSSPKRYLWDTRPRRHEWRFNAHASRSEAADTVTKGIFVGYIDDEGRPLDARGDALPAIHARYSRSSIMCFALAEIVLQAIVQINSYARRSVRAHADVPRRLRNILMTMPTAMPLEERNIFEKRAREAVDLLWRSLGWDEDARLGWDERFNRRPRMPEVKLRWDEATCTQLVYLYSEVVEKFRGNMAALLDCYGRQREEAGPTKSLRVASLDVGGGTTDLIITTYVDEAGVSDTPRISPKQNFREGFNIAGDDILRGVIERQIIPTLASGVERAGVREALGLVNRLLGPDHDKTTEVDRALRRKFAEQVLRPIALGFVAYYEGCDVRRSHEPQVRKFAEFFEGRDAPSPEVLEYFERAVERSGGSGFKLERLDFAMSAQIIDAGVRRVIGRVIEDLCEIVHSYACDVLLLSGRPSRLPAVLSIVRSKLPVEPGRIQPMHRYPVGPWYPFRDAADRISDPKTTVSVGAMLCLLAQGNLRDFFLDTSQLRLKSTARFIGIANVDGEMKRDRVLFSGVDLDQEQISDQEARIVLAGPVPIVFRQLDLERWPTTQLYSLELTDPKAGERLQLPLSVSIGRGRKAARSDEDQERMKENFVVLDGIEDRGGRPVSRREVTLRLQTLKADDIGSGYWLDSGAFSVS